MAARSVDFGLFFAKIPIFFAKNIALTHISCYNILWLNL